MTVKPLEIAQARGKGQGERFLNVGVSGDLLRRVNMAAAARSMRVRDFVVESLLKNLAVGGRNGRANPKARG